jgi:hypothetical protein
MDKRGHKSGGVCGWTVHTCEDVLEGELDVAGVQGRRLDERKVVLACGESVCSNTKQE